MKRSLFGAIMLSLAGLCVAGSDTPHPHLFIATENSPPSVMLEKGRLVGFTTEKIREIMQRAGVYYEIEILPFKRAFLLAQTRADVCTYSLTRLPEREKLFK